MPLGRLSKGVILRWTHQFVGHAADGVNLLGDSVRTVKTNGLY